MTDSLALKSALLKELAEQQEKDLAAGIAAQKKTADGATHEESRAENDKDTRAIESTYLARGQAERVHQLRNDLVALERLQLRAFEADSPIALGACVRLEQGAQEKLYLMAPCGAGLRLGSEGQFLVVTPPSPLGKALLGQFEGDEVQLHTPSGKRAAEIIEVF